MIAYGKSHRTPSPSRFGEIQEETKKEALDVYNVSQKGPLYTQNFRGALIEVYGEVEGERIFSIWTNEEYFNQNEIELSGDMWNIRLFKAMGIKKMLEKVLGGLHKNVEYHPPFLMSHLKQEQTYVEERNVMSALFAKISFVIKVKKGTAL